MKAFWWFKENRIAGMARPGFNSIHWSGFPIDEGILLGWLGQYSTGHSPLYTFRLHLEKYAPKVFPFFNMSLEQGKKAMGVFDSDQGLLKVLASLAKRSEILSDFSIEGDHLYIELNESRIRKETDQLKQHNIHRIISLTEQHHNRDILSEDFDLHHISVKDLHAPSYDQVVELADIIQHALVNSENLAVHCLAGIGRTSTMLLASHALLGEAIEDLKESLSKRNPAYVLTGEQGDFISKLHKKNP